jgi:hypothetical protein
MVDEEKNEVVEEFLSKCRADMRLLKDKLFESLEGTNRLTNDYLFYAYEITLCDEIYNCFEKNRGGVGIYAKNYVNEENPLMKIYNDMITNFTEPTLINENKLYKLIDKKGF